MSEMMVLLHEKSGLYLVDLTDLSLLPLSPPPLPLPSRVHFVQEPEPHITQFANRVGILIGSSWVFEGMR